MSTILGNPMVMGAGGSAKKLEFTYTGDYTEREDGVIEFRSSGTFVPARDYVIDTFHVGGGAGGATNDVADGAGGGGSGYTKTQRKVTIKRGHQYVLTIGQGGAGGTKGITARGSDGGTTSGFVDSLGAIISAAGGKAPSIWYKGGNGGSGGGSYSDGSDNGGAGGTNGGNGGAKRSGSEGAGQGTNTYEFGEESTDPLKLYAGGGAGGNYYNYAAGTAPGGARGGGNGNGGNGEANTGGGGGGGKGDTLGSGTAGGTGGSGIICIRLTPSA